MAMDMYGDGGGESSPAAPAPGGNQPETSDSEDANQTTAVLPKSILAGKDFKPGEEIVLEIVRMNEDSVEVKYASEPKDDDKPEGGEMTASPEPVGKTPGGNDLYS